MRSLALVLVLTLSCADASSSFAASGATNLQAGARLEEDWILAVHSGGVDRALPDPRDAGLRRALQLLDDRLLELAVEQRGFAPPPELTGLALEWLSAPWTLHLGARPPVDPASAPEFRAQLVLHVPEDRAEAWAERLRAQLATFGMSSAESSFDPDLIEVPLPMGTLYYGASELGLAIAWGRSPVPTRPLDGRLPGGATTGLSVDLALGRLIDLARATGAPGDPLMDRMLPPGGDLEMAFTAGHDARGALFHLRYRGWVSTARAMGLLDETPLARTSFDLVPADATIVTLSRLDLGAIAGLVKDLDARTGQFATGSFERATGLPLEALFAPLGGTVGWYLSDSTGAGGLNSLVFLATLDDEDGMQAAIGGLADRATLVGAGHVRVRRSPRDSGETFALEFPGLPVPLELALAVDSGHLFAAASPQALEVALRQARRGKGGLTEHPALRGLPRGALDGLQGFSFLDNARLLRDGYPFLVLAASALANGVRSGQDPARDPGLVLPPLPDLLEGARPGLTFARIDGEDLVVAGEGDGSVLVQLGALVSYARILVLPAVLPALVAPRVLQSVALAQSAKARADIVSLHDALDEYAIENGGRYPDSLDGLDAAVGRFDPWGAPYLYELVRGRPRVYSLGADGVPGGYGDDADIELPR